MRFGDLAPGPAPQLPLSTYAARRRELARRLGPGQVLVLATHPTHQYSNDVDFLFRPHSDFWYLTGFDEPGAMLVLRGGSGSTTLFLRSRDAKTEIWTGRRLGLERACAVLDVDRAYDIAELSRRLPGILGRSRVHVVADHDAPLRAKLRRIAGKKWVVDVADVRPGGPGTKTGGQGSLHARVLLHEMRLIKDRNELAMLQKACALGVAAHKEAATEIVPGGHEYRVEAAFAHHARHYGSTGVGYPSICGCGPNAAVLHYVANRSRLEKGRLLLIDAGCEWGYYTSDITRTYPVGGEFSRDQLAIYELVEDAHKAAMSKVRPGRRFRDPHDAAVQVLSAGLVDLGLVKGRVEQVIEKKRYRDFFMHGTSHFLGLDVHDAGSYVDGEGKPRVLEDGMVLTIEPGLYFNPDFAKCPARYRGIGIRIEDDVAVTAVGRRLLSRGLATDPSRVADLLGQ